MSHDGDIGVTGYQLIAHQRSLKVFRIYTDSETLMQVGNNVIRGNASTLTDLEVIVQEPARVELDNLVTLTSLTHLNLGTWQSELVEFPPALRHLTWNARIVYPRCVHGNRTCSLPVSLISLTLGSQALNDWCLNFLNCVACFGIRRMCKNFKRLTIRRDTTNSREWVLRSALGLPSFLFQVDHDDENIHVTLKR